MSAPVGDGPRVSGRPGRLLVTLPGAVPGWVVRTVPALLALALGSLVGRSWAALAISSVVAAVAVWRPSGAVPTGVAALLGVLVLTGGRDLLVGARVVELAVLVLGVHLVAAGCALARHVAWTALVDPAAIGVLLLDLAPVQLVAQSLVLTAWAVHGAPGSPVWRVVGVLGLAAAALLVLAALPGRRPTGLDR